MDQEIDTFLQEVLPLFLSLVCLFSNTFISLKHFIMFSATRDAPIDRTQSGIGR